MPPKRRRANPTSAEKKAAEASRTKKQNTTADADTLPAEPTPAQPPPPPSHPALPAQPAVPQPPAPEPPLASNDADNGNIVGGIDHKLPYQQVQVAIRMLVPSSLGESLEDPANPIIGLLTIPENSNEDLTEQVLKKAVHIEVSPHVAGAPERVVYVSGTCSGTSYAVAAIAEYSALRNVLDASIVNEIASKTFDSSSNVDTISAPSHSAPLPSPKPTGKNQTGKVPDVSSESTTNYLLSSVLNKTGIQLTMLIPEHVVTQKQLKSYSEENVSSSDPTQSSTTTTNALIVDINTNHQQTNGSQKDTKKKSGLLSSIAKVTNSSFQLPSSTLPLSSDRALHVKSSSIKLLQTAVNQVILRVLVPTLFKDQKELEDQEEDENHTNKASILPEAEDDPSALSENEPLEDDVNITPTQVDYVPRPVAGVYGHPETFQRQYLNDVLVPLNPYITRTRSYGIPGEEAAIGADNADAAIEDSNMGDGEYSSNAISYQPVDFVQDNGGSTSNALVSADGTVHIARYGGLEQAQLQAQSVGPGQPITQHVFIPNDIVGVIIGKQGANINELRKMSGSMIKINEHTDEHGEGEQHESASDRRVTIIGTSETNQLALTLLYQRIESERNQQAM